ncbi:hypothetical protein RvY_17902 [Ramazzottius varieornatus]|uniref:G-protein coupled receptors family 1 profile domain-containing protein n=1 Tax=Ramazzottius varieornatus TaxID=947166 RepID=A0A1D1W3Z7_RAMVA|nr:hypothetical protein RvY_17902 [Ramazzottius varieornatus]
MTNSTIPRLSNSTLPYGPSWTFSPSFTLSVQISAILMNGSVLTLFVRSPSLLTPFTIYVMNLFLANLSCAILFYTIELVSGLYSYWWRGHAACTYYNYTNWIFNAAMCNAHALIALNRLWAVTFPVSYQLYHRKRFALGLCAAMWIYLHACLLPGIIQDALWYRLPEETNGCLVNTSAQQKYAWAMQIIVYDIPEALVLLTYPVICYKTWKRRRANNVQPSGANRGRLNCRNPGTAPSGTAALSEGGTISRTGRRTRKVNHGFLSLTLMTLTVLICYSPGQTYFTLLLIFSIDIPNMYPITSAMNALIIVLDPIWFVLAVTDLRNAFRRTYCG